MRVLVFLVVGLLLAGCRAAQESARHPAAPGSRTAIPTRTAAPTRAQSAAPTRTPEPTAAPPAIRRVSARDLGPSWHPGCPVGPAGLRAVTVPYFGFDGHRHQGTLVVAARVADDVRAIFGRLYADRFPIRQIVPVSAYGGDDERSMEADNSSAFNCRPITGGTGWSKHAYGTAVDVNTMENPYLSGDTVEPTTARRYVDRTRNARGMIHAGDPIVSVFATYGWTWGGSWTDPTDYQHFQLGN